ITNNTRLGYELNMYLSPNPVPVTDTNAVKLTFRIEPAPIAGVPQQTDITTMKLTAQDMEYLTSSTTGKVYNQMEIIDRSEEKILPDPDPAKYPYLEVQARVTVSVLVSSQNDNNN
ncbi:MAG TPA: hypothetical protein VHY08_08215, partial [Bacillota bacterium]|nr:hypothetical protein [Bacillota bacterium]